MADIVDDAQQLEQMHLNAALEAARVGGNERLTGKCHWCGEPTQGIVCSRECRDDMTKAERMRHG